MKSKFVVLYQSITLAASLVSLTVQAAAVERPPQYVLLAFDGSKENTMWERTRKFGVAVNAKLTYFISGVYFLTDANRKLYHPPAGKNIGASDIGFGGEKKDLEIRIQQVLAAKAEGHEIASHANGHFDGGKWSAKDWEIEFSEFDRLLKNVHQNNAIDAADVGRWQKDLATEFIGFRAPLLGSSAGLWETLKNNNFAYDTTRVGPSDYWPTKTAQGFWNFPLASLVIAGTAKKTLSMDYNFYYADSVGKNDPDLNNAKIYEERMLKSYMNYFTKNYYGNRGPIHIGHHFSKWNNGAYLKAFERFGKTVCSLPEVKCVTYRELATFLESQSAATIADWQKGNFPKFELTPIAQVDSETKDITLAVSGLGTKYVQVSLSGADADQILSKGHHLEFAVNGVATPVVVAVSNSKQDVQVSMASLWKSGSFVLSTSLRNSKGEELQKSDHKIVLTDGGFDVHPTDLDEKMRLTSDPAEAHAEDGDI